MASRRKPGAEPPASARLERARQLLGVLQDVAAVYQARPQDQGPRFGYWSELVPALRVALDELEAGAERASRLRVGTRPATVEDVEDWAEAALEGHGPLPLRPAGLEDLAAWLEAVVEPEGGWTREEVILAVEASAATATASGAAHDASVSTVPVSEGARRLVVQGPDTVALEQTLARAPLFAASTVRHGLQLELGLWRTTGSLYGQPFRVLEPRGPLTVRDALGLAHLLRRWADSGYPEDRRVRASENEAVGWFGYSTPGGRQRELLREAMGRLRATTFQSASRVEAGRSETLTWGLIDYARTPRTGPEGRVSVTISEPLAYLVRVGRLAYLDAPTFAALVTEDELAARLWVFLEAEELPWRWSLYSAPEGQPPAERDTPAIADLLRISGWERRRDVARRVTQAARAVERVDPRYRLSVARAPKGRGMWTLHASARVGTAGRAIGPGGQVLRDAPEGTAGRAGRVLRDARSRSETAPTVVSLPSVSTRENLSRKSDTGGQTAPSWDEAGAVMEAWRMRYPRPPTTRQLRVLAELVARHDAPGIARALREAPADEDALRAVMARDRRDGAERRREAKSRERAAHSTSSREPEAATVLEAVQERVAMVPVPEAVAEPPRAEEDEAEIAARRRVAAVAWLRAGLEGPIAARLRTEHGITDDELGL